jgi:TRAP-type C4-dicarboxylate transport system permease small subunit
LTATERQKVGSLGSIQSTPATQISFAWIYLALPLGMAMTLIHWLLIVRRYILQREFASDAHFDATASASL